MRQELIKARKDAHLTQKQLADIVDVDRSYIAHLENGSKTPSLSIATRIAVTLNKPVEFIFLTNNVTERHFCVEDVTLTKTSTG